MTRGMPPMTALLGMLALAGYQNRDKLAEMFNNAAGSLSKPEGGGQPRAQGDILSSLGGMLGGAGVGGLWVAGSTNYSNNSRRTVKGRLRNPGLATDPTRRFRLLSSSRPSGRMFWRRWCSRQGFPRKSFLLDFRENYQQPSTSTRRTVAYPHATLRLRIRKMSIIWTIIIGFLAGLIAKFIMPGDNEPSGFIMTTILGIVGAFVASFLGQALGWYKAGEGAGFIGAVVGAIILLLVYGFVAGRRRGV